MESECPHLEKHIAVRLNHCLVIFGGYTGIDAGQFQANSHNVWLYNLYLEQWRKYQIPKKKQVPQHLLAACGVVIGDDIYTFGGHGLHPGGHQEISIPVSNELWKLTRKASFEWNRILVKHKKNTPSPRAGQSGWEYDGKFWIFGGCGPSISDYLNEHGKMQMPMGNRNGFNNQLLHFNPVSNEWKNLKCYGTVPSPRSCHATTVLEDITWVYGGQNVDIDFNDLYELGMCSLTWTKIQTEMPMPPRMSACSLNVTRENQLVLHCGQQDDGFYLFEDTWILDQSSYSWTKCTYDHSFRAYHTGSLGINNNIIIIGGTSADDFERDSDKCAPMCNIMLEPKSLQQMSIMTVYKYHDHLPCKCLPKKLIKLMQYGSEDDTTDAQDSPAEADKLTRSTQTAQTSLAEADHYQTCLIVRLNRILYDLHAKLRQYVFRARSTILRYVKRRFHRCKDSQCKRKQRYTK